MLSRKIRTQKERNKLTPVNPKIRRNPCKIMSTSENIVLNFVKLRKDLNITSREAIISIETL